MIESSELVPMKFFFGASSCVPASNFETSGATLNSDAIKQLLKSDKIKYLSEVMNFPGVLNKEPDLMRKIKIAKKYGKPIDGHAPGLSGSDLEKYISAGISTDHESITKEEALLAAQILREEFEAALEAILTAEQYEALLALRPDKCAV